MRLNLAQRLALAATLLLILAGFGKNVAASIIASRGDEFSSRSGLVYSQRYYERALDLDPGNATAAIGYVRTLYLLHTPESMRKGMTVAEQFLAVHSSRDRAYFEVLERHAYMALLTDRFAIAEREFESLSLARRSAEDADLAFRSAQRLDDRPGMRRNLARIAAWDPGQMPGPSDLRKINL